MKDNHFLQICVRYSLLYFMFGSVYSLLLANHLDVTGISMDFVDAIYDEVKFLLILCSIGWFLTEVQGFAKRLSSKRIVCIELVFGTIVFVLVATYHLNSFSSSRFNPLSTNNNLILHSASGTANSGSSEMESLYDADKRVGLDEQRNKQKNINYERGGSDLSFISIVEQNTKKELVIQFYETVLLSIFEGNKGTKLNSEEQQSVIKHSEMLTKLGREQRWDEFEFSSLTFRVDLIDWHRTSTEFQNQQSSP